MAALTFLLARKLFDANVAWLSALLTIGCELLWRFSVSGLSTMLLLVIFLGLTWCVLRIEELAREPQARSNRLLGLVLAAGVLTGLGALTRYAFGWAIIPVVVYLFFFSGQRRMVHVLAALGAFLILLAPWVVRNYAVSGTPFGTAGFAIVEGTGLFPQFQLERSLQPDLSHALWFKPYVSKFTNNAHDLLTNELPKLGGSWASVLFLAGLLLGFRGVAVRRMRYFLLMCLGVFIVVQALGRTQLSDKSPEVNSENLLVLLVPLVFCYGVSFFFTFLEQMKLAVPQLRYVVIAGFAMLSCLPMIFTLLSHQTIPVVYPPYYPPDIQQTAGWMKENELMMSDVPWAVAWYGHRQCLWLTLNAQDDFFAVNDNVKPVLALYLTPETTDGKFVSDWIRAGEHSWGNFMIQAVTAKSNPAGFPAPQCADRVSCPNACSSRTGNAGKQRNKSGRRAPQPVGDAGPPRRFRRRFNDDQLRARRVAAVQFRVNRPRKRLRIMGNHAHPGKILRRGNMRVSNDMAAGGWRSVVGDLRPQIRIIAPVQNQQSGLRRVVPFQQPRTGQRYAAFTFDF